MPAGPAVHPASAVSTVLHYAAPLTSGAPDEPWCIDALSRPPEVIFNFRMVPHETVVMDLRDSEVRPTLDTMGFEKVIAPTRVDQRALAGQSGPALDRYRRETIELLTSVTGAARVELFDATLRRQDATPSGAAPNQTPHLRVHVDQTPSSARARAVLRGGEERRYGRFQIVNVWRPLLEPVRNYPLALCDYRSLDVRADLVATRLDFPDWLKDRESYSVKHSARHRWHYWRSLSPDEVLLFKCYDSASRSLALAAGDAGAGAGDAGAGYGGAEPPGTPGAAADVAGLCPHTAFYDDNGPAEGHLRTSLEIRAVLFYD
ncbi:CmcJ/NvfI family oxidoreductase [Streptomyces sp. NPDC048718]|uniref:CmcJ/NvfI family oxidoreductase n=1 Tax=Streptomyces sp. NPDC048718 TaxID=3365587 RepID=UPI0037162D19